MTELFSPASAPPSCSAACLSLSLSHTHTHTHRLNGLETLRRPLVETGGAKRCHMSAAGAADDWSVRWARAALLLCFPTSNTFSTRCFDNRQPAADWSWLRQVQTGPPAVLTPDRRGLRGNAAREDLMMWFNRVSCQTDIFLKMLERKILHLKLFDIKTTSGDGVWCVSGTMFTCPLSPASFGYCC